MSEVRKYSWPLSLSRWKCKCLVKKKKSGLKIFAIAIFCWIWGFGVFWFTYFRFSICSIHFLFFYNIYILHLKVQEVPKQWMKPQIIYNRVYCLGQSWESDLTNVVKSVKTLANVCICLHWFMQSLRGVLVIEDLDLDIFDGKIGLAVMKVICSTIQRNTGRFMWKVLSKVKKSSLTWQFRLRSEQQGKVCMSVCVCPYPVLKVV